MLPAGDIDAVTLALLNAGASTLTCRLFKERPLNAQELAQRFGWPEAQMRDRLADAARRAERATRAAASLGLQMIAARTPGYPARLWDIADPPIVLWAKGHAPLDTPSVAIVGARQATPAGLLIARQLGHDLASAGWTVVSGMAAGVDGAAHQGALDAGGQTVAVLGCGADVVYPQQHRALAARMVAQGRLLSEFAPGTPPRPWHFPLRNRLISGLALAVVVVEASERSGSLITARLALEQGRDVLAVPGSAASGRYRGSHALIRDGARLVETVDDILDELEGVSRPRQEPGRPGEPPASLVERHMAVGEPYTVDDLVAATGQPGPDLLAELGTLEVEGRIRRVGGGSFVRLDAAASVRRIGTSL